MSSDTLKRMHDWEDPAKLKEYVAFYDKLQAARMPIRRKEAEAARAHLPTLARLCREFGAKRVRLFGSLVTEYFNAETPDIDLAIEGLHRDAPLGELHSVAPNFAEPGIGQGSNRVHRLRHAA